MRFWIKKDDSIIAYNKAKILFNDKKKELLELRRIGQHTKVEQKLINEINILAEVLNENKINEEHIEDTLFVYPTLCSRSK